MTQTTISRRRFLVIAGAGLGATALTCSGLAALGSRPPAVALPDITIGEKTMSEKILVTYASQSGFTAGVAEAIGRTLAESRATVDVRPMREVCDLTPYGAVVAGSAIHGSKWLPEAMRFVQKHQAALAQQPFAAFLVCMALTMANENYRRGAEDGLTPVRKLVRPVSEGYFAGGIDFSKLPLIPDRLVLKGIVASGAWEAGDHRDWEAIRTWATGLKPLLMA